MAKRSFDWREIQIFQVDERCVPPDNALSNFRMMRESLLDAAGVETGIEEKQVHRIHGESTPDEAAGLYVGEIRRSFHLSAGELPVFDAIARGMGPDAHTTSLFPGEPLIGDRSGIAAAVFVEKQKSAPHRITLLRGVLEGARHTLCLAAGGEKAEAIRRVRLRSRRRTRFVISIEARGLYCDLVARFISPPVELRSTVQAEAYPPGV
jgi:6-phosphogluconolactonase